jgi:hypothetical protein
MTFSSYERFEIFMTVRIQVVVFWDVTPCIDVVGYQHFRGPCYLHFQGEVSGVLEVDIDIGQGVQSPVWPSRKQVRMVWCILYTTGSTEKDRVPFRPIGSGGGWCTLKVHRKKQKSRTMRMREGERRKNCRSRTLEGDQRKKCKGRRARIKREKSPVPRENILLFLHGLNERLQ